jgi:hypothetical protein
VVAVAEHDAAGGERGLDALGDQLRARGHEKVGLRLGRDLELVAVQQEVPDALPQGCAPRLAHHQRVVHGQRVGQEPQLGRLAGPLGALQRHEETGH